MKKSIFALSASCLIVFAPAAVIAQNFEYCVPYYSSVDGTATGVGIRNLSDSDNASVEIAVYDRGGARLDLVPLNLPPGGQKAFGAAEGLSGEGSIVATSNQPLAGLCFVQRAGAFDLLADIPFSSELSKKLSIPHVAQNRKWDSTVYLANPNPVETNVELAFQGANGIELYTLAGKIPAFGSAEFPLEELLQGNEYANGSVTATSSEPVAGFALYNDLKSGGFAYAGINAVNLEPAEGGWTLYDDFESGEIDDTKWSVDDSSADISTENGKARFIHKPGRANDSAWLTFPVPEDIKAIKVDVGFSYCSGDIKVRLCGSQYEDGQGKYVWQQLQLKYDGGELDFWLGAQDPSANNEHYPIFDADFERPVPASPTGLVLFSDFSLPVLSAGANSAGSMSFSPADGLSPNKNEKHSFKGFGTYSEKGMGPCTVYFDNVYVRY
jgi:hypothetical protein